MTSFKNMLCFQRPWDSQRWPDTNHNTMSQSLVQKWKVSHFLSSLMFPIWDTMPNVKPLRKPIQSSEYLVSPERKGRKYPVSREGGFPPFPQLRADELLPPTGLSSDQHPPFPWPAPCPVHLAKVTSANSIPYPHSGHLLSNTHF